MHEIDELASDQPLPPRCRNDSNWIKNEKKEKENEKRIRILFNSRFEYIIKNANWPRKISGCRAFKFIYCTWYGLGSMPFARLLPLPLFLVFVSSRWWRPCVTFRRAQICFASSVCIERRKTKCRQINGIMGNDQSLCMCVCCGYAKQMKCIRSQSEFNVVAIATLAHTSLN